MSEKIYLSNPGFICAAGNSSDTDTFVKNLAAGNRCGIKKVECGLEGENGVKSFYAGKIPDDLLKPVEDKFDMRVLQILDSALSSVKSAVQKAVTLYGENRVGVCIGSCDNGSFLSLNAHKAFFEDGKFPSYYNLKAQGADYVATFTSKRLGVKGVSLAFSTACSSSASAIIKAKELIKAGICDAVIAGGVDVASDTVLLGFDSLEAIDHEKTNPFSKNRNGINLGEGAAVFVLSKDDLDETGIILAGTGESSDASHMTAPLADGTGAEQAMKSALADAQLSPAVIDYINLHGTGTHLNDSMEAKGVNLVFGKENPQVLCSSTKPLTGHTLGAAGSLELAACFFALKTQKIPVHVWDGVQDEEIPVLNLVKSSKAEREIRCCMSNSFAFGGCNASLIVRKESL
ncbi:beta-ketoacyl synthase N-terminal-like domain-containing protein [Treponema sp.]|uniref:beta-ketoacyl synthase N-terminal-like domain-containing protein n=1 Tax=Treponema sp. TaxID=166 RepID=UPI00388FA574